MEPRPHQVLMIVTSHDRIDDQHPTGLWLEEFAVPYTLFRQAGLGVTVASPRGGATPIDPNSKPTPEQEEAWAEASSVLQDTVPVDRIDPTEYEAVFIPGGHGTMFDLPDNETVQRFIEELHGRGKVVAAVCHGPAALVNVRNGDGTYLVETRRLTAFTDAEEREVKLDQAMPFLLESRLRERGAHVEVGENWADHVVVDGPLVTGQNPQSSHSTACAVLEQLTATAEHGMAAPTLSEAAESA